jgi:hypothetical protein
MTKKTFQSVKSFEYAMAVHKLVGKVNLHKSIRLGCGPKRAMITGVKWEPLDYKILLKGVLSINFEINTQDEINIYYQCDNWYLVEDFLIEATEE